MLRTYDIPKINYYFVRRLIYFQRGLSCNIKLTYLILAVCVSDQTIVEMTAFLT